MRFIVLLLESTEYREQKTVNAWTNSHFIEWKREKESYREHVTSMLNTLNTVQQQRTEDFWWWHSSNDNCLSIKLLLIFQLNIYYLYLCAVVVAKGVKPLKSYSAMNWKDHVGKFESCFWFWMYIHCANKISETILNNIKFKSKERNKDKPIVKSGYLKMSI